MSERRERNSTHLQQTCKSFPRSGIAVGICFSLHCIIRPHVEMLIENEYEEIGELSSLLPNNASAASTVVKADVHKSCDAMDSDESVTLFEVSLKKTIDSIIADVKDIDLPLSDEEIEMDEKLTNIEKLTTPHSNSPYHHIYYSDFVMTENEVKKKLKDLVNYQQELDAANTERVEALAEKAENYEEERVPSPSPGSVESVYQDCMGGE